MNDAGIMYKLSQADIPTPRSVKPDVSEALDAIVQRALAFNPDDRYPDGRRRCATISRRLASTLSEKPRRDVRSARPFPWFFTAERAQVRRVVEEQLGARQRKASTDQFSAPETAFTAEASVAEGIEFRDRTNPDDRVDARERGVVGDAGSSLHRSRVGIIAGIAGARRGGAGGRRTSSAVHPWQTAASSGQRRKRR